MCSLWVYVGLAKVHCGATPPSVMVLFLSSHCSGPIVHCLETTKTRKLDIRRIKRDPEEYLCSSGTLQEQVKCSFARGCKEGAARWGKKAMQPQGGVWGNSQPALLTWDSPTSIINQSWHQTQKVFVFVSALQSEGLFRTMVLYCIVKGWLAGIWANHICSCVCVCVFVVVFVWIENPVLCRNTGLSEPRVESIKFLRPLCLILLYHRY